MQKSDGASNMKVAVSCVGSAIIASGDATPITGVPVDTNGFSEVTCVLATNTLGDADLVLTPVIQESDDLVGSNFSAVADADLIGLEGSLDFSDDLTTRKIGYIGTKRYIRMVVTPEDPSDATPSTFMGLVILGCPRKAEVAQEFKNTLTAS